MTEPTWQSEGVQLYLGDCLEVMKTLPAGSVDAVVTDPPYGLGFMGKDWDRGMPGAHFWREALRVAKPGAHLLAFGGTRTFHRLACAIEDAGWEIRDCVMWVYGSGFPKSHDVSKAIDKAAGVTREVIGIGQVRTASSFQADDGPDHGYKGNPEGPRLVTAPATPEAARWQGWGTALKPAQESIIIAQRPLDIDTELSIIVGNLYRLEAQLWLLSNVRIVVESLGSSPSGHEEAFAIAQWTADDLTNTRDALCAQMDMSRFELATDTILSTVSSWLEVWGEALRLGSTFIIETATGPTIDLRTLNCSASALTPRSIILAEMIEPGSWWSVSPAARVLHAAGTKLCGTLELFAVESAIDKGRIPPPDGIDPTVLGRPIIVARKPLEGTVAENVLAWGTGALNIDGCRVEPTGETRERVGEPSQERRYTNIGSTNFAAKPGIRGGASAGRWPANLIHDGSEELMALFPEQASGALSPEQQERGGFAGVNPNCYGTAARGGVGSYSASSGSAARFFYCAKASRSERGEDNKHPTVKPVALMRYLCRLVTPPNGIVLDPFMGSGTTGVAAVQEGFRFIGIDVDPGYFEIAKKRISDAQLQMLLPLVVT